MDSVPQWLHDILREYSTDRFHILFDGYKHNHMAHGVISLWKIGADEQEIRSYAEKAKEHLEPAIQLEELNSKLSEEELKELLGAKQRYLHLVKHYMFVFQELEGDLGRLINQEFPQLAPSLGSEAIHGLIHTGYGYSVGNERIVCEGLALLHFAYVVHEVVDMDTLVERLGTGDKEVLTALEEIRNDSSHAEFLKEGSLKFNDARDRDQFWGRFHKLLVKRGDQYARLATSIQLPSWFNREEDVQAQVPRLCQWIVDCCILVYSMSEVKNNFFILHGVTGAWALSQILPVLQGQDKEILKAVVYFLSALIAVYISQDSPLLQEGNMDLGGEHLQWNELKKKAIGVPNDEHVYKIVQVCSERSQENEDPYMDKVYRRAASIVLDYPYSRA